MSDRLIQCSVREKANTRTNRRLRADGIIPAVVYSSKESLALNVNQSDFYKLFREVGEHHIITLKIENKGEKPVLIKDLQHHPIKKTVTHVDFFEVESGRALKTSIPIRLTGTPKGVKQGGVMEHFLRLLQVECLPKDIPEEYVLDITELKVNHSMHIRDLNIPESIKVLHKPDQVIVAIVGSRKTKMAGESDSGDLPEDNAQQAG